MMIGLLALNTISLPPCAVLLVQVTPAQVVVMVASPPYCTTGPWSVQGNPLFATQSRSNRMRFTVSWGGVPVVIDPAPMARLTRSLLPPTPFGSPGSKKLNVLQVSPAGQSAAVSQPWFVVVEQNPLCRMSNAPPQTAPCAARGSPNAVSSRNAASQLVRAHRPFRPRRVRISSLLGC